MREYCSKCGNLKLGCETTECQPLHVPPEVDNTQSIHSFLKFRNYQQQEKNPAIRRIAIDNAFFREITWDSTADPNGHHVRHLESLGPGNSETRGRALIRMLDYNYAARAFNSGWQTNREEDIKYIKEHLL